MRINYYLIVVFLCMSFATFGQSVTVEIESNNQGVLLPKVANTAAVTTPVEGLMIYDLSQHCVKVYSGTTWSSCLGVQNFISCKAYLMSGYSQDGIYIIDPDGPGGNNPINCYCDMTTDGGGWTLVLNYLHKGGTNPGTTIRTADLPLMGNTTLGNDESGSNGPNGTWGHASNTMLSSLSTPTELRFYGITANHNRIIHFKSSLAGCINNFLTGTGSCAGLDASFTAMAGHSANLPASMTGSFGDQGDFAMTNHPFFTHNAYHWNIDGTTAGGDRWEVDDWPNSFQFDTYHQIWVR